MSSKATLAHLTICGLLAVGQAIGAPIITDFNPTVGAPGDQVVLIGSGFSSGNISVAFGNPPGVVVTQGVINSDTQITLTVPSGITTGPISIQQGSGQPFFTASNFLAIGPGPYISGFFPPYGAVNDSVIITGVHFANTLVVLFNGTLAHEFVPNADGTQISTRVPVGATSGPFTVTTIIGTSNNPTAFTVVGPGPFITGFSPNSGDAGTTVQIVGLHFTGAKNVTFNGRPGVNLVANSDTLIQVQAPSGLTSGPIGVNTPLGSTVTTSNFFGKPAITGFSPPYGRANTNVVIMGTNFLGSAAVYFGGVPSTSFSVDTNANLSALVPAGALTGLIRVVVPGSSSFSATNFTVQPSILGFSPIFGPVGSSITITGANLNAGTPVVRFNGVQALAPTGPTFSQLVAQVPVGATSGQISVTTADGSDTNANLFFLPGAITGFAPTNSGPGSKITIIGQNLTGTSTVGFNGTPASAFTISNNTAVEAAVPDNVITGPITVTTPAGVIQSSGLFYAAPVITNFTPTHGLPGNSVTISGVNFLGGKVQFAGLDAALVSLNNTQIVATVPSSVHTGPLTVLGPAGTNTSTGNFTVDYPSDLAVWITNSSNPATIGGNLVYTIVIVNNGPFPASNATLTNILPATVTLRAATITGPWVIMTNANTLTGSATNLGTGSSSTLIVSVTPQVTGNITDTISVASDNPDSAQGNNTASVTTTVEPLALLSIGSPTGLVKISWPALLTNYVLQFQDGLAAKPLWLNLTNPPTISGASRFVIETNPGPSRFFRLKE